MFTALAAELSGPAAAGLTACELEDLLDERGREVIRQLLQDHYDLRTAREEQQAREQRTPATGPGGITRTRLETGHGRLLATLFGTVRVTRCAWRKPGAGNWCPAGAALSLPAGRHLALPGEAGCAGGSPRLVRGRARGHRPPERPGHRQTAARAGRDGGRRRYPRVLRCPGPGAVHATDAGGPVRRLQGHRDAARGAAGHHREGRRPDADQLKTSVQNLGNVDVAKNGLSSLQTALTSVQTSASVFVTDAKSAYPSQTAALSTSLSGLHTAITSAKGQPLATAAETVVPAITQEGYAKHPCLERLTCDDASDKPRSA